MLIDPYMDYERVKERLVTEYRKYGNKFIIAFDFDNTVYDTHNNGCSYEAMLELLKKWRPHAYLICWTASKEERYPLIFDYLLSRGVRPDAINSNAPWIEEQGRKIYANAYLDDRCGLSVIYRALNEIYEEEIANAKAEN